MPNRASAELNSSGLSRDNSLMDSQYLDAGCATASGNRYGTLNQDYCVVQEMYTASEIPLDGKQTYLSAVCDGHALLGDKAAIFAGKAMVRALYAGNFRNKKLARLAAEDCQDEMRRIFAKGHAAALSVYESAPLSVKYPSHIPGGKLLDFSLVDLPGGVQVYRCNGRGPEKMFEFGTTATVAVLQGRRLCLGNVGDSAAVLGSWDTARSCYAGEIVTRQHWGLDKEEAARINEGFSSLTKVLDDGYIKALDGPLLGYELSVTRALGHRGLAKHGVLAEPHVVVRDLEDSHCCVVVASDGVWDVMAADEVVIHVMASSARGLHGQAAAAALVAYAVQLGTTSPSGQQDNTSAAVLFV